jgi:glutamyl-Q tRNA(Asp) synthetase
MRPPQQSLESELRAVAAGQIADSWLAHAATHLTPAGAHVAAQGVAPANTIGSRRARPETRYRGRFAPSPTGPLHLGSLVAALASWLDAHADEGLWLIRIEDIDPPREVAGSAHQIIAALARFGLLSDEPVLWQSARGEQYAAALDALVSRGLAYRCTCSRREVGAATPCDGSPDGIYRGRCRTGCDPARSAWSWRLRVDATAPIAFIDRAAGKIEQDVMRAVGDFVLRRSDGLWAYQLAVVVDDAAQAITHVVRGADLLDNTARQIHLQRSLGLATPRYLHVPVVRNANGEKLSKQTGARALREDDAVAELERAWQHLGFAPLGADTPAAFLRHAVPLWQERWLRADTIRRV